MPQSLVVFPEMFSTGFTMNPEKAAETMDGETVQWMAEMSKDRMICGSLSIKENGSYYNRFLAFYQGEKLAQYDKRHLFSYGGEHEVYETGSEICVFTFQGFKIAPFICYDLRFPAWIRKTVLKDKLDCPDVLLFVANWPSARISAWDVLLKARAIENQAFVIGVNRLGNDDKGLAHNGHTQAVKYDGDYLLEPHQREAIAHIVFEKSPLVQFRERFPFLSDADGF
jgi:predicted amidohydrolase